MNTPGNSALAQKYDPALGVHDERSLRAAGQYWEALQYEIDAGEWGPAAFDRLQKMQCAVERAIAAHDYVIDENDKYVPATNHHPNARAGVDAAVMAELERATSKFPTWPTDPLHALGVLGEEFGELGKAVLQSVYEPHKVKPGEVRAEAVQTAAMALRFLMSLDAYVYAPGEQHEQGGGHG